MPLVISPTEKPDDSKNFQIIFRKSMSQSQKGCRSLKLTELVTLLEKYREFELFQY